jgi:tetratricopeptide (TPR) repeat protein
MGVCYKIMQQYEEAIEVFDRAISISASEESSIFNKGMCLLKLIISTDGEYF